MDTIFHVIQKPVHPGPNSVSFGVSMGEAWFIRVHLLDYPVFWNSKFPIESASGYVAVKEQPTLERNV